MAEFQFQVEEKDFLRELTELQMEMTSKLLRTFDLIGFDSIAYLRSLTSKRQPPARTGEPSRRAHPGGWADVSSNLALSYRYELFSGEELVRWSTTGKVFAQKGTFPSRPELPIELVWLNGMEYAAYLEARDGYWVVREVTEEGGPVHRAARTVMKRIAPEVDLRIA